MNTTRPKRRSMCFLRALIFSLFTLLSIIVAVCYAFFHFTDEDIVAYHHLMLEANPRLANKIERAPYVATQLQQNVRKDLFISKGTDRLHFLVTSQDVNLTLDHQHRNTNLLEELTDVKVFAQHELLHVDKNGSSVSPESEEAILKQKICFGSADRAFLSYSKKNIHAEGVHGIAYEAPGHALELDFEKNPEVTSALAFDAKYADFDGNQLMLKEGVHIDHALGTLTGNSLIMKPLEPGSKCLFDTFLMKGDVVYSGTNQAVLKCDQAEYSLPAQRAHFEADAQMDSFVLFQSPLSESKATAPLDLITVQSRSMQVNLRKGDSECPVETLTAQRDVSIHYADKISAFADRAEYQHGLDGYNELHSLKKMPGKVTLTNDFSGTRCHIVHLNEDQLSGSLICIDTNRQQMLVDNPEGFMQTSVTNLFQSNLTREMLFPSSATIQTKADRLLWDFLQNILTLQGNAVVTHSGIGTVNCDREARLYYSEGGGKKQLRRIESDGHTVLRHHSLSDQTSHWLVCDGKMVVDHESMQVHLQKAQSLHGGPSKQIFYYDPLGEVQADKAVIYYQNLNGKLEMSKLLLEGNVYIVDHKGMREMANEESKPLHYVLADFVDYTPSNKQMYLSSKNGGRVLFYDKINQLQVSAPALTVTRDQNTKKETVKGFGDVRFHFLNNELEQLLKRSIPFQESKDR